jgi:hypothetical protein
MPDVDQTASARPWWVLLALLIVVVLVTPAFWIGSSIRGSERAEVDDTVAALAAVPGVRSVETRDAVEGSSGHEPLGTASSTEYVSAWVTLAAEVERPADVGSLTATARRIRTELDRRRAGVGYDVWLVDTDPDGVRELEVLVPARGASGATIAAATEIADLPGVVRTQVGTSEVEVVAVRAAHFAAVQRVAAEHGFRVRDLATTDGRSGATVLGGPARLDEPTLRLAGELELVPFVEQVRLEAGEFRGSAFMIRASDDETVADVAQRLASSEVAGERGDTIAFTVWSAGSVAEGFVGGVVRKQHPPEPMVVPEPVDPIEVTAPAVAAWPDDPAAPSCTGSDLDVRIEGIDYALGRRFLLLVATNVSGRPCAVQSRPDIVFVRASGTPAPGVSLVPPVGDPSEPTRLVVPTDEEVRSTLEWRGMSTSLDPDVTVELAVVAVPGGTVRALPVSSFAPDPAADMGSEGPGSLDVLEGAVVEVSPWRASVEGWG